MKVIKLFKTHFMNILKISDDFYVFKIDLVGSVSF